MVWAQQTSSPVTSPLPTPITLTDGKNIEILALIHSKVASYPFVVY